MSKARLEEVTSVLPRMKNRSHVHQPINVHHMSGMSQQRFRICRAQGCSNLQAAAAISADPQTTVSEISRTSVI